MRTINYVLGNMIAHSIVADSALLSWVGMNYAGKQLIVQLGYDDGNKNNIKVNDGNPIVCLHFPEVQTDNPPHDTAETTASFVASLHLYENRKQETETDAAKLIVYSCAGKLQEFADLVFDAITAAGYKGGSLKDGFSLLSATTDIPDFEAFPAIYMTVEFTLGDFQHDRYGEPICSS